jgi:hypothetical protein
MARWAFSTSLASTLPPAIYLKGVHGLLYGFGGQPYRARPKAHSPGLKWVCFVLERLRYAGWENSRRSRRPRLRFFHRRIPARIVHAARGLLYGFGGA